jgi:hypothetical protein
VEQRRRKDDKEEADREDLVVAYVSKTAWR